ncbi:MAG: glycosyltransferase, partial [Planctomycetes bacterium]|nr:glycosyltransferase [Planctomycetota bacterium]
SRIHLLHNPQKIKPPALNMGLRQAHYDLIAIVDAHTQLSADYLRQCILEKQESGATMVGGTFKIRGHTFLGCAIAASTESVFGVGTAAWRSADSPQDTDTVPFGLFERQIALELGGFDETLIRNHDYEFCYRLRASGGRVRYSPKIIIGYYSRQNLRALWRQYFQYGLWKVRVLQLHPRSLKFRHLFPPLFVLGLIIGITACFFGPIWRMIYIAAITSYLFLSLFFSIRQAKEHGWRYLPLIPLVFATLHIAWGSGFLFGLWYWWLLKKTTWP